MCGRYSFVKIDKERLIGRFALKNLPAALQGNPNISPTQSVPVILNTSPFELSLVCWGLIPHWASREKIGQGFINARAETILEKPAFKSSIRNKRCLILADGFYEWKKTGSRKKPFKITLKDESPFVFAGIWDVWTKDSSPFVSCAIITTTPNELVRDIHDRMPVILSEAQEKLWLGEMPVENIAGFLKPFDAGLMKAEAIETF